MTTPLVTIACIAYNHGLYIRQTLDGFLSQKVNFDYEIVVHDDASTDDTQAILNEYKQNHPDKIKLILRKENIYSLGVTKIFYHNIIKHSEAKYIATCEGDDYWTDEYKLQKQIDFLEANVDYNFSVGKVMRLREDTGEIVEQAENKELFAKPYLTIKDYLKTFFSQTSTYVFRRDGYNMPSYCNYFHGEDILMVVIATKFSKIKFHKDIFSVYRIHSQGVTQKKYQWKMHYLDIYNYSEALNIILDYKYKWVIASIKWRLYFDYKLKVANNSFTKYFFTLLSLMNNFIKRRIL